MSLAQPISALDAAATVGGPARPVLPPSAVSRAERREPVTLLGRLKLSPKITATLSLDSQTTVGSTAVGDTADSDHESPTSRDDACPVLGRMQQLIYTEDGCRQVQQAFDEVTSEKERELLVKELHGNAIKAMRSPHANHVLQKCITVMPPASLQFMVDEIVRYEGVPRKIAMHRYGTRILQQLLCRCWASQLSVLVEALLKDCAELSCHSIGNFAIQRLLQFCTAAQQYRCVRIIEQNIKSIAKSPYGVGVIATAMEHVPCCDRLWIARAALKDPELFPQMAELRQGSSVILRILSALPEQECAQARQILMDLMPALATSRYGRKIRTYLKTRPSRDVAEGL